MDRGSSGSGAEKRRQRNVIEEQVKRYLEQGGCITVLDAPAGVPGKAVHTDGWTEEGEFVGATDL